MGAPRSFSACPYKVFIVLMLIVSQNGSFSVVDYTFNKNGAHAPAVKKLRERRKELPG